MPFAVELPLMGAAGDPGEAIVVAQLRPRRELSVESRPHTVTTPHAIDRIKPAR